MSSESGIKSKSLEYKYTLDKDHTKITKLDVIVSEKMDKNEYNSLNKHIENFNWNEKTGEAYFQSTFTDLKDIETLDINLFLKSLNAREISKAIYSIDTALLISKEEITRAERAHKEAELAAAKAAENARKAEEASAAAKKRAEEEATAAAAEAQAIAEREAQAAAAEKEEKDRKAEEAAAAKEEEDRKTAEAAAAAAAAKQRDEEMENLIISNIRIANLALDDYSNYLKEKKQKEEEEQRQREENEQKRQEEETNKAKAAAAEMMKQLKEKINKEKSERKEAVLQELRQIEDKHKETNQEINVNREKLDKENTRIEKLNKDIGIKQKQIDFFNEANSNFSEFIKKINLSLPITNKNEEENIIDSRQLKSLKEELENSNENRDKFKKILEEKTNELEKITIDIKKIKDSITIDE